MRCFLCAFLVVLFPGCQEQSQTPQASPVGNGSFCGIVYRYAAGTEYTVVAAAHTLLNHKFLAVKVRVYNLGQQSVTVKPDDIRVEGHTGQPGVDPDFGHRIGAENAPSLQLGALRRHSGHRPARRNLSHERPDESPVARDGCGRWQPGPIPPWPQCCRVPGTFSTPIHPDHCPREQPSLREIVIPSAACAIARP
jgi:hypothetical protein